MLDFPTEFPADAAKLIVDHHAGTDVPCDQLCLATWNVMGYAKGQAHANAPKEQAGAKAAAPAKACSEDECVQHLEACCDTVKQGGPKKALNVPWDRIFLALLTILQKLAQE